MYTRQQLQEKVDTKKIKKVSKMIREILDILQDIQDDEFEVPQASQKDVSKIIPMLLDADKLIKGLK